MAKVERVVVADGDKHLIECAVRADLTVPFRDFMALFEQGMWSDDPEAASLPDDAQIKHADKVLGWLDLLAEEGVPPYPRAVNNLDNGVWEFKIGSARMSYFDTDGNGQFSPKFRIRDRDQSHDPDDDFWWYPIFDEFIRLGYTFPKTGDLAGPYNTTQCEQVRAEDLAHDH